MLKRLESQWKEVDPYDDVTASWWVPEDAVAEECREGCTLEDTGWMSMVGSSPAADAYRRTLYCRTHGFARIYVIGGPDAAHHGWEPS